MLEHICLFPFVNARKILAFELGTILRTCRCAVNLLPTFLADIPLVSQAFPALRRRR
jgi:hypothetical protein